MDRRTLIVLAGVIIGMIVVLVAGLGLSGVGLGPDGGSATTSSDRDGGDGAPWARIAIDPEVTSRTNDTVSMRIEVDTYIQGYDNIYYENPRLCLYDENGTVLGNESLRDIQSPTSTVQMVNVTLDERPIYYTVEHPELRTDERFAFNYRRWDEEEDLYESLLYHLGEYPDTFDYPRTNQTGHCP